MFAYPEQKYGLRFKESGRPVIYEDFDRPYECYLEDKITKMILWDNRKKALWAAQEIAYQYTDGKIEVPVLEIVFFTKKIDSDLWIEKWSRPLIPDYDFD